MNRLEPFMSDTLDPKAQPAAELPPSPEQLIEAMLFVGGHPLAAAVACAAVRGLTADRFQDAVAALNKRYATTDSTSSAGWLRRASRGPPNSRSRRCRYAGRTASTNPPSRGSTA